MNINVHTVPSSHQQPFHASTSTHMCLLCINMVCLCIYIYIYIHTHTHTHTYVYHQRTMHAYICIYAHTWHLQLHVRPKIQRMCLQPSEACSLCDMPWQTWPPRACPSPTSHYSQDSKRREALKNTRRYSCDLIVREMPAQHRDRERGWEWWRCCLMRARSVSWRVLFIACTQQWCMTVVLQITQSMHVWAVCTRQCWHKRMRVVVMANMIMLC